MKSLLCFLLTLVLSPLALAEEAEPASLKKNVTWNEDPLCQFVFFAVLEGLYRDGVQSEVVDLVLGKETIALKEGEKVKHCFVFKCELCHATYEAFRAYRARPSFANSDGQTTFGEGVSAEVIKRLQSEKPSTRVFAMGALVRPWIQQRVQEHRLNDEEKESMQRALLVYARKGQELLNTLKRDPNSVYVDWDFYGSCQACEAAKDF